MKRLVDVCVATAVLLLIWPLLLLIAASIRVESPGGAIFAQERVGRNCRTFKMLKFRSMVANAAQLGGYSTALGDPRITRVGAILRRTSLDELPQLLNVLKGDMSLVGPRPDVPQQRDEYSDTEWSLRHKVRPGLTGLAQAIARHDASPKRRTTLDLFYVRSHSMCLDCRILMLTVRQVLLRRSY